jgi:hypothetical protein
MAPTNRRNALAATLIAAAAVTALAGIAIGADETLFGQGSRAKVLGAPVPLVAAPAVADETPVSRVFDTTSLGNTFDVAAPVGGVMASQDDTTVTIQAATGRSVTVNLNREQTYVFSGDARWFVGSDKPVLVFSGRDHRVQPIR